MAAVSRTSLHFRSLTTPSFSSSHKYSLKPSRLSVLRSSGNSNSIPRSPNSNRLLVRSVLQTLESADTSVSAAADLGAVPFPKPRVLVSEKLGEAGLEVLRGFGDVDCSYDLSPEELCAKISRFDALIVRSGTKVTRQVFEAAQGRLKVVGRAGVGIDNVDLQAATEFGCLVVNAPTANTIAAAEHGIALLASMARNVAQADASMKAGKWQRSKYVGVSLVGKTLAVMGFGKVGSEVARRAKGLGMHVIAHDPYAPADRAHAAGVDLVSFDQAISTADFISLHMPLTPHLTCVGSFSVDVSLEGNLILCRQTDQPGMIGSVGNILGESNVNVSFMSVGRTIKRTKAIMAIGVDEEPDKDSLKKIGEVPSCTSVVRFKMLCNGITIPVSVELRIQKAQGI